MTHPAYDCDDCGILHGSWSGHHLYAEQAARLNLVRSGIETEASRLVGLLRTVGPTVRLGDRIWFADELDHVPARLGTVAAGSDIDVETVHIQADLIHSVANHLPEPSDDHESGYRRWVLEPVRSELLSLANRLRLLALEADDTQEVAV